MAAGIETRHARTCGSRNGGGCTCSPTYQAHVWSSRDGRRIRKTFPTMAAAKAWRQEALVALRQGTMRAPSPTTLREASEAWLAGAKEGSIRNRSGDRYKPSAIRTYDQGLRLRVLPELGGKRLSDLRRVDLQDFVDRMVSKGSDPSTIQSTLMPVRAICRRAVARGELTINPTTGLELPAIRGRRDRIVSPEAAADLVAALPRSERALWATALYAGLRRGELMALAWEHVSLAEGIIRVERSWDAKEGYIEPKSAVGRRKVPIPSLLRDRLVEHRMAAASTEGLVFGRTPDTPFDPHRVVRRAQAAWEKAELESINFHEARHTFASLMIAAGVNAKALSTYMGHGNISITLDRYGHLMPGNEEEAAGLLDAYLLERSNARARSAGAEVTVAQTVAQVPETALESGNS